MADDENKRKKINAKIRHRIWEIAQRNYEKILAGETGYANGSMCKNV